MPDFSDKVAEFFIRLAVDEKFAQAFAAATTAGKKKKFLEQAGLSANDRDEVNQTQTFNIAVSIAAIGGTEGAQQQTQTGSLRRSRVVSR